MASSLYGLARKVSEFLPQRRRQKGSGPGPTCAYYDVPVRKTIRFQRATQESTGGAVWDYPRIRGTIAGSTSAARKPEAFLVRLARSEEHTSELQSLRRISYAVFC